MSRREEIQRRGLDEFNDVRRRCDEVRSELLNQERATLAASPEGAAAFAAYETALSHAYEAYQAELLATEDELAGLESEAIASQDDSDVAAVAAWRQAGLDADAARKDALGAADAAYNDAYNAASRITGSDRDRAFAAARRTYEAASRAAESAYLRATDAAWRAYVASNNNGRETAIAAIDRDRRKQQARAERAATTHERAKAKAGDLLERALGSDPVLGALRRSYATRHAEARRLCEAEKREVLARMRRDLAAIGG